MRATPRLMELCERFQKDLSTRAEKVRAAQPKFELPPRKNRAKYMNDGPLCRCSARARKCGIRHGIYSGESSLMKCDLDTNNADKLYHYRITISPPTNFLTKTPTIIHYDEHEFIFEGFSMFSHFPLEKLPTCKVIRFNIEYMILYVEEKMPESFSIRQLDLFCDYCYICSLDDYIFHELLELVDLDFRAHDDKEGCPQFHFMPRFSRDLPDNGKEILSMNEVMRYLINNGGPLIDETKLAEFSNMPQFQWQNFADEIKGMVVTYPGMKPCSLRVDQLDRDQSKNDQQSYPEIVHFGIRPPQLSYAGNLELSPKMYLELTDHLLRWSHGPSRHAHGLYSLFASYQGLYSLFAGHQGLYSLFASYQKAWRDYVKFRHLLANMPKPSFEDKRKLECKEIRLQEMRTQSKMKRDVTVAVSAKGFYRTGIMCDVVQHAMLIPVLVCHLRFHRSCDVLEKVVNYKFKNRFILQLALTHPSYRENFGTNPDHARNTLTNCGIRQPEYGDRRIHYMNTRKRGENRLKKKLLTPLWWPHGLRSQPSCTRTDKIGVGAEIGCTEILCNLMATQYMMLTRQHYRDNS
ncbi:unnamed protein product, partial [Timema podura]|nr:unnamed protein product [Timema podura]